MGFLSRLSSRLFGNRQQQGESEHDVSPAENAVVIDVPQIIGSARGPRQFSSVPMPPPEYQHHRAQGTTHFGYNIPPLLLPTHLPAPELQGAGTSAALEQQQDRPVNHNEVLGATRNLVSNRGVLNRRLAGAANRAEQENAPNRLSEAQMKAQNDCHPGFTKRDRAITLAGFITIATINQAVSSAAGSSRVKIDSCVWQTTVLFFVGFVFVLFPWFSKEKDRKYWDSPIPKMGLTNVVISLASFCINFFPMIDNKITRFSIEQEPELSTNDYSESVYILGWIACSIVVIAPLFWQPVLTALKELFLSQVNYEIKADLIAARQRIALLESEVEQANERCQRQVELAELKHENNDQKKEIDRLQAALTAKCVGQSSSNQNLEPQITRAAVIHSSRRAQPEQPPLSARGAVRFSP